MTAPTSQKLADALRAAGFDDLAKRAKADEFHEFFGPHAAPGMLLAELLFLIYRDDPVEKHKIAAMNIRQRLIDGDFEASEEESAAWAMSAEGKDAFKRLTNDK